jgi:hypothetical protein
MSTIVANTELGKYRNRIFCVKIYSIKIIISGAKRRNNIFGDQHSTSTIFLIFKEEKQYIEMVIF